METETSVVVFDSTNIENMLDGYFSFSATMQGLIVGLLIFILVAVSWRHR